MGIIGSTLHPFTATAYQKGKDFFTVTEADLAGKWSVFFFYPADFTFVCPTELEDLGEHYAQLQKLGVEVFAVSTDTHFSHKAWHDTSAKIGKLAFPFLGDQAHALPNAFGVLRVAGVEKEIVLPLVTTLRGGNMLVLGQVQVDMTDFGITPPTAMMGVLKTDPKVNIRFETTLAKPTT